MLKQVCFCTLNLLAISSLQAASNSSSNRESTVQEKYDIMRRDQMDGTDALAIPLDDSEVEDEEEINLIKHKEVFSLPQSSKSSK